MVLICLHGKINENHWTSAINWGQFPTMFDYRRGTSHGAPAIDAVLWQPRPRNTKSIGICIFKVTYDPLTEFHMLFFCWVFIYMFFCSKKCMFYMIWSCFIIRVNISSTCQALCPIFHAFFSASKWPWRIRIGTWAERHRAAEHWTWRPWKNAWFGLVWTSTEKLHIWWENPWLSYRCSTVQPKKQLLVWLGFSKRRFASCKRLHRRKKTS